MKKVHERNSECVVVVMTAFTGVETAVKAMRQGASDYLTKPVNMEELLLVMVRELELQTAAARKPDDSSASGSRPSTASPASSAPARSMQKVFDTVMQVSAVACLGADRRRERHRQGADRRRYSRALAAGQRGRSSSFTARRWPGTLLEQRAVPAMSAAPSPARSAARREGRFEAG